MIRCYAYHSTTFLFEGSDWVSNTVETQRNQMYSLKLRTRTLRVQFLLPVLYLFTPQKHIWKRLGSFLHLQRFLLPAFRRQDALRTCFPPGQQNCVAFDAPPPQKNTIQGPMRCEGMLNCKVWMQHEHVLLWSRSLCVSRSFRFVSVRVKSRSVDGRIPGEDAGWVLTKPRSCRSGYSTCLNRLFFQVLVPVSVTWEINAFFSNHVRILLGVLDLWLHTSATGTADLHFALIYRLYD